MEKDQNEEDIDVFHKKCLLFRSLLVEEPSVFLLQKTIKSYIDVLKDNSIYKEYPSEWFYQYKELVKEINYLKTPEKVKLLSMFELHGIHTINVYRKLDRMIAEEKKKEEKFGR